MGSGLRGRGVGGWGARGRCVGRRFLLQLHLDEERGEEAESATGGKDEPEVDVVPNIEAGEGIDGCTETQAEEHAPPTQGDILVAARRLLFDEQFGCFRVGVVVDDGFAEFALVVVLLDRLRNAHDDGDDGNAERENDSYKAFKFNCMKHNCEFLSF